MKIHRILVLAVVFCGLGTVARADGIGEFNTAFADAWGHYRQTLFYLKRGASPDIAAIELESFVGKWRAVVEKFAGAPPREFAGDPDWRKTLRGVAASADKALAELDRGEAEAARQALLPVRGELGDLHRRNGVARYSDRIDELSAAMNSLAEFRRNLPDPANAGELTSFVRRAAILDYVIERCREYAPTEIRDDEEFRRLIDGARVSMDKVWESLATGETPLLRVGIGELRSYERILFLRFG